METRDSTSNLVPALDPDLDPTPEETRPSRPLWRVVVDTTAFALSALMSPYLVLPFGTLFVIGSRFSPRRDALLWTLESVFFSTFVPTLYVVAEIRRGKVTDVHIMDRAQRGAPFMVAIASSAVGAFVLWKIGAPTAVWSIGLVVAVNGIVLTLITNVFKISMHVAVLSSTVMAALMLVPDLPPLKLLWMIPALMWARVTRGRHTIWQGLAGCAVSCGLTYAILMLLRMAGPY